VGGGVETTAAFLAASPLLEGAPPEQLEDGARACSVRELKDGEAVWRRDQPVASALGVRTGIVKVYATSRTGRRLLADLLGPGEWVGLAPLTLGRRRLFDHAAAGPSSVVVLPAETVRKLLDQNARIQRNAYRILADRYHRALAQLYVRSVESVEVALAHRLSDLLERYGEPGEPGGRSLPFQLSQEELGHLLGVSRKAVGACLRRWEQRGWIELGYARLSVRDPASVAALLEEGT
jgi:CRP-like cAMP-binding protein